MSRGIFEDTTLLLIQLLCPLVNTNGVRADWTTQRSQQRLVGQSFAARARGVNLTRDHLLHLQLQVRMANAPREPRGIYMSRQYAWVMSDKNITEYQVGLS